MFTNLPLYLLQINCCLIAFYLFYFVFLRKERCFTWNRLYITGAVVLSSVIPLLEVPVSSKVSYLPKSDLPVFTIFAVDDEGVRQTPIPATEKKQKEIFSPLQILWAGYVGISLLLLGRLFWRISKLLHFGYRHTQEKRPSYRLVHTQGKLPTFSFFRMLFWDNSLSVPQADQTFILTHELAHIRQWHSLDAMMLELLKTICWFNPVVYLLRKSLEEVHEYLADASVTGQYDAGQYSRVMAAQVFNQLHISFTQCFNRSLINKRIAMIHLNYPPKPALWKLSLSLPLIAVLFVVYSCRTSEVLPPNMAQANTSPVYRMGEVVVVGYGSRPVVKDVNEVFNKYNLPVPLNKSEEVVYEGVDKAPTPEDGMEKFQKEIQQTIHSKAASKVNGTVYVQAIVDASGNLLNPKVLYGINEEYNLLALEAINKSPKWNPGKVKDTPVATRIVIPVVFGKNSSSYSSLAEVRELSQKPAAGEPMPQEGMESIYKYLTRNLRYLKEARSNLIGGQVVVGFTVQTDGTLADVQLEESVFPALDVEVLRVIQESNLIWKPAMENGQVKQSRIVLPVTFKIG